MTKRLKWSITTITLFILALFCLLFGTATMKSTAASAAESDPTEAAVSSGWYLTGNGAGVLEGDQWAIEQGNRLTGTALDAENYLGVWRTSQVLMYQGDQFKFVYEPSALWESGYYADYRNLVSSGAYTAFVNGGNNNMQARTSGYYIFSLTVAKSESGNVVITLYADLVSSSVPEKELFNLYAVGDIPYYPTCQWPHGGAYATHGVPMTYDEATNTWSTQTLYLNSGDGFKVYNTVSDNYFPGGLDNDLYASSSGWYKICWRQGEGSPYLSLSTASLQPSTTMVPGWYLVGAGAGSLKPSKFQNFQSALRLSGSESMISEYTNYYGTWSIDVTLYQGDQFKILYNDGSFTSTRGYKWSYYFVGVYQNIESSNVHFTGVGADNNIQVPQSGKYTITITPQYGPITGVDLKIRAELTSTAVEPIPTFDMYVVGKLKNYPNCGWPGGVSSVAKDCIGMAYNAEANTWRTPLIYLTETDFIKVYNAASGCYYPSGNFERIKIDRAGWYYVEWGFDDSQNIRLILA